MRLALICPLLACLLLGIAPGTAVERAPGPAVTGVEPPDWFVGHPQARIQLLVRGTGLDDARLVSRDEHVKVIRSSASQRGTYVIGEVSIDRDASVGPVDLFVESSSGNARVAFSLKERLDANQGFQGIASDEVIYLVLPDRFADGDPSNNGSNYDRSDAWKYHGGDFRGLESKLPYLKDLGVTAVWMTPIYDNDDETGTYHGYHVTDFYGLEEHFGTPDDLRSLIRAAHSHGIKVIVDQVANHTGPAHAWLKDAPTPTWLNGTPEKHLSNAFKIESILPGGNLEERRATLDGWFGDHLPDLNQADPECARYLIQNSMWWLESFGFDVIRQDTLPYVPREFVREWALAVHGSRPSVDFLGEVLIGNEKVLRYFQGGVPRDGVDSGVDALFDFPLSFAVKEFVQGRKPAERVAQVLAADSSYADPSSLVALIDNHDMHRYLTRMGGDRRKAMMAMSLLYTMRGPIQLYYGEEIGMEGARDPDNRRDFPTGGFAEASRTVEQRELYDHMRRLIQLRRQHSALIGTRSRILLASGVFLVVQRESRDGIAVIVANMGPVEVDIPLYLPGRPSVTLTDGLGDLDAVRVKSGHATVRVPAKTVAIFVPATS